MVYGWASMAGMGTGIWLMARLCRTTLRHPLLLVAGARLLESRRASRGRRNPRSAKAPVIEWLEFPPYAAIVLFIAYSLVISWAVLMFRFRRGDTIYITQWYLLAAFLWFPWLYAAAQVMLFIVPVQGVMQTAVNWWYREQSAVSLARRHRIGHGLLHDSEGDRPSGLQLSSGRDRVLDLCALRQLDRHAAHGRRAVPGLDDHGRASRPRFSDDHSGGDRGLESSHDDAGYFPLMRYSPTLRFTVFGAISYTVFSLVGVLISLRSVASYVHFTRPASPIRTWVSTRSSPW